MNQLAPEKVQRIELNEAILNNGGVDPNNIAVNQRQFD